MDRRAFLKCSSAAALSALGVGTQATCAGAAAGRVQINMGYLYRGTTFLLLNLFKTNDRPWITRGSKEDGYALLDAHGMPEQMPRGGGEFYTAVTLYLTSDDHWVVDWQGIGSVDLDSGDRAVTFLKVVSNANRREYSITSKSYTPGTGFVVQVRLTGVTRTNRSGTFESIEPAGGRSSTLARSSTRK